MVETNFKQTEIGLIPEDWEVEKIKDFAIIKTGAKNTQDKIENGTYPFFVRSQQVERINTYSFDGEAILTAGDGVGVGKVMHYINGKFDCHQRVYRITGFRENISGFYFYKYFSNNFYARIMQMTAKSSVDSVRMDMIAEMYIPIPHTKDEQQAIAKALSDTDAWIGSLENLIAKKRLIKQGAMQKLLTPQEDWEVKKLGDFLDYLQPTKYLVRSTEYNDYNSIPVLTAGKTFILGYTDETDNLFDKLPVIIFDDFTTATKFVDFPFKAKSSAMKMLIPKHSNSNIRFMYEIMQMLRFQVGDHKRHWIGEFQSLDIKVPKDTKEQTRIANILSDMDKEIDSIEHKLEKAQQIKQGMMQQLLTGKIRLVTANKTVNYEEEVRAS